MGDPEAGVSEYAWGELEVARTQELKTLIFPPPDRSSYSGPCCPSIIQLLRCQAL